MEHFLNFLLAGEISNEQVSKDQFHSRKSDILMSYFEIVGYEVRIMEGSKIK